MGSLWQRLIPAPSTIVAFLMGAVSWLLYSNGRRLLGRPRLIRSRLEDRVETRLSVRERATQIASADLRAGIEKRYLPDGQRKVVLCAGMRNFREPWARDFSFASFGLVELSEVQALRETLEVFLQFQTAEGQFPVKVHSTNRFERYLLSLLGRHQPTDAPLRPKYVTGRNTVSLDGNALLVIAALNYLRRFADDAFCRRHWSGLKKALNWLEGRGLDEDGLLRQGPFTDWADSVGRVGAILYTNVLYWKAVHEFAVDAPKYGYLQDHAYFEAQGEALKKAINDHFWNEELGYYVTSNQFQMLGSDGNLLAVAWGLADKIKANRILDNINRLEMDAPVPTKVTSSPYDRRYIALENRIAGISNYHTTAAWLWLGAWHVVALARLERTTQAAQLLRRIDELIVRDDAVHEVYDQDGHVLSTFWYTSEAPLTWSAGMMVYAHAAYQRALAAGS